MTRQEIITKQKDILKVELQKREMTYNDICSFFGTHDKKKLNVTMLIDALSNECLIYEDEVKIGKRSVALYGIYK